MSASLDSRPDGCAPSPKNRPPNSSAASAVPIVCAAKPIGLSPWSMFVLTRQGHALHVHHVERVDGIPDAGNLERVPALDPVAPRRDLVGVAAASVDGRTRSRRGR